MVCILLAVLSLHLPQAGLGGGIGGEGGGLPRLASLAIADN